MENISTAATDSQNWESSFPKSQSKIFLYFLSPFFPGTPQTDFSLWENQIYYFFFFFHLAGTLLLVTCLGSPE